MNLARSTSLAPADLRFEQLLRYRFALYALLVILAIAVLAGGRPGPAGAPAPDDRPLVLPER